MNGYETQDRLTIEILKYIKALHILAALFLFSAPSLLDVPKILNLLLPKIVSSILKIFLRTPMHMVARFRTHSLNPMTII